MPHCACAAISRRVSTHCSPISVEYIIVLKYVKAVYKLDASLFARMSAKILVLPGAPEFAAWRISAVLVARGPCPWPTRHGFCEPVRGDYRRVALMCECQWSKKDTHNENSSLIVSQWHSRKRRTSWSRMVYIFSPFRLCPLSWRVEHASQFDWVETFRMRESCSKFLVAPGGWNHAQVHHHYTLGNETGYPLFNIIYIINTYSYVKYCTYICFDKTHSEVANVEPFNYAVLVE